MDLEKLAVNKQVILLLNHKGCKHLGDLEAVSDSESRPAAR